MNNTILAIDLGKYKSVACVLDGTAEVVAAYLNDASRFKTGKQVSAYGGLVPRQHQSGEMDRRGRITKRGPALLRKLLVECAWCMLRYNAWARGIYLRLIRRRSSVCVPI
jgi:transposase